MTRLTMGVTNFARSDADKLRAHALRGRFRLSPEGRSGGAWPLLADVGAAYDELRLGQQARALVHHALHLVHVYVVWRAGL